MEHKVGELMDNMFFWACFTSWLVAQSIKVVANVCKQKRLDFRWFLETGGMPSSHTSSVTTVTILFGYYFGFNSPLFTFSLLFAIIIMSDAAGVRRSAGKQAMILNQILSDISQHKGIKREKLRELIGHSPLEVFVGIALGLIIAYIFMPYIPQGVVS